MRPAPALLSLLIVAACTPSPTPPAPSPRATLPALGSARPAGVRATSEPIAPMPEGPGCVLLAGPWPGELTACYDTHDRLRGVELDVAPARLGEAVLAVRGAYVPDGTDAVVALGGSAWEGSGVRLEIVREAARVHVRALVAHTAREPSDTAAG